MPLALDSACHYPKPMSAISSTYLLTVPLPPVRTAFAMRMSLSRSMVMCKFRGGMN